MMGLVLANTALALTNVSVNQEPRFFRTVRIESDDHILIAITKQTTRCDRSFRFLVSLLSVCPNTCSIVSVGIAVSIALSTSPDPIPCATNENFLSCI